MKNSIKGLTVLIATVGAAIILFSLQPIEVEAQSKIITVPQPKPPKINVEIGDITVRNAETGEVIKVIPREDVAERTNEDVDDSAERTTEAFEDSAERNRERVLEQQRAIEEELRDRSGEPPQGDPTIDGLKEIFCPRGLCEDDDTSSDEDEEPERPREMEKRERVLPREPRSERPSDGDGGNDGPIVAS